MAIRVKARRIRSLAAMVSVTALLATSVTTLATTAASAASASKSPIKIGTVYWNLQEINLNLYDPGINAAVRAINKSGGINGHKLQWINCGAADANGLEACARQMVSSGVIATIDDAALIDEVPVSQILAQAGIPEIDPFVTAPQSRNNPNVYLMSASSPGEFAAIMPFMKAKKLKTFHILYGVSTSADDVNNAIQKAATYYGLQEKGTATAIPLTAADYTPFVADAATSNADVNIVSLAPFMVGQALKGVQQLGKQLVIGYIRGFDAAQTQQYGQPGGPLDHALITDEVPPLSAVKQYPGLKLYLTQLHAEFKSGDAMANPQQVTSQALHGWLVTQAFTKVAQSLKTVTRTNFKHALKTVKNVNLFGIIPPWTPSRKGPAGFRSVSDPYVFLITVHNGKEVLYQDKPVNALLPFGK